MVKVYDPVDDVRKIILDKINEKGWNVYETNNREITTEEGVVRQGPVDKIEINRHYVLYPITKNPKDSEEILEELEKIAVKMNREMPTISLGNYKTAFTGFTPYLDKVKLHVPEGLIVNYSEFIDSLDSIVDIKQMNQ